MGHNETARQVQDPQLAARIADLEDARAIELLALVLEQDGRIFDPLGQAVSGSRSSEALGFSAWGIGCGPGKSWRTARYGHLVSEASRVRLRCAGSAFQSAGSC